MKGPYRLTRNPMYVGVTIVQIGLGEPEIVKWNQVSADFSPLIKHPLANDDFVLGNNHQNDQFILNSNTLLEKSGSRIFDGGTGNDYVRVPYDETDSHGRANFKVVEVNGELAIALRAGDEVRLIISLGLEDGYVNAMRVIGNPDKLKRLSI